MPVILSSFIQTLKSPCNFNLSSWKWSGQRLGLQQRQGWTQEEGKHSLHKENFLSEVIHFLFVNK